MKSKCWALIALSIFMLVVVAVAPKAGATWSSGNNTINVWMDPNQVDNAKTVYYAGETYTVDAVRYGWQTTQYFYLHIKNDNYPNDTNLEVTLKGIINGPVPSANWDGAGYPTPLGTAATPACEWVAVSLWSGGAWVASHFPVTISDLDNNENAVLRIAFNFQNEVGYSAGSWFPGNVQVQYEVRNADNDELYRTVTSSWWVWDYPLENTVNYAVADAWMDNSHPSVNQGDNTLLCIAQNSAQTLENTVFLKFPLTVPANWGVQHAYLKYYIDSTTGTFTGRQIETLENTTWVENVITFSTSGGWSPTAYATSATLLAYASTGWNTMDITDIVQPRIAAGDSLVTIFLKEEGAVAIKRLVLRSKEYGDGSYAPQLILEIAPIGLFIVSPTFFVETPTQSDNNGSGLNLLLRGFVENMGDDSSANFTFWTNSLQWSAYKSYVYPTAVSTTGYFSLTTTGYQYEFDRTYYIRIQCHGNNTQTYTWSPTDTWLAFVIPSIGGPLPPPENRGACTLITTDVTGKTDISAMLHYVGTVGAYNTLSVCFDIAENADNLDNYTTPSSRGFGNGTGATAVSISGTYTYTGLDNGTTYCVRARGVDTDLNVIYGGWMRFTTTGPPPLPPPPPSESGRINITRFADLVGNYLFGGVTKDDGSSTAHEAGGLFLSAVVIICILVALAYIRVPQLGIVGVLIVLVGLLTAITWVPLWIGLVIGLGFSLLMAQKVVKAVR